MSLSSFTELDLARKKIILIILAFAISEILVAVFAYSNDSTGSNLRTKITDIEVMITAGITAILAMIVVARQGVHGLHGKTYAAFAIGASLWFTGEIIWAYLEVVLQIELPSYSWADVSWLLGYGFFGYHLFKTYVYFAKTVNRRAIILVGTLVGVLIAYVIYQMVLASAFDTIDDNITFIFRTSYPIGDFVLIVPSILLLLTLRKAKLHFSPWFFISLALLVTAAADTAFSYLSLIGQADVEWLANLLYDSANLCLMGGLYWYYRFVVLQGMKS